MPCNRLYLASVSGSVSGLDPDLIGFLDIRKKLRKLKGGSFFCSLEFHRGLSINILKFFGQPNLNVFQLKFFHCLVINNLDPDPDSTISLDPDPDSMNNDQKSCISLDGNNCQSLQRHKLGVRGREQWFPETELECQVARNLSKDGQQK